jgi:hypothetical protein
MPPHPGDEPGPSPDAGCAPAAEARKRGGPLSRLSRRGAARLVSDAVAAAPAPGTPTSAGGPPSGGSRSGSGVAAGDRVLSTLRALGRLLQQQRQHAAAAHAQPTQQQPAAPTARTLLAHGGAFETTAGCGTPRYAGGARRLLALRPGGGLASLRAQVGAALGAAPGRLMFSLPGGEGGLLELDSDADAACFWEELAAAGRGKLQLFAEAAAAASSASEPCSPPAPGTPRCAAAAPQCGRGRRAAAAAADAGAGADAAVADAAAARRAQAEADAAELRLRAEAIAPWELQSRQLLGSGAFGEVHLARWRGCEVACKRASPAALLGGGGSGGSSSSAAAAAEAAEAAAADLLREGAMLARLRHPNVLSIYGAVLPPAGGAGAGAGAEESPCAAGAGAPILRAASEGAPSLCGPVLVTEHAAGGSLRAAVARRAEWLEAPAAAVRIMLDVARVRSARRPGPGCGRAERTPAPSSGRRTPCSSHPALRPRPRAHPAPPLSRSSPPFPP